MTAAGLLLLYAALAGSLTMIPLVHKRCTEADKTADQTGRRFMNPEALDERKTTR